MSFFTENDLKAMKHNAEKERLDEQMVQNDIAKQKENKRAILHKAYDMFLDALKEYPKVAQANGISPATIIEKEYHKSLFGTKTKEFKKTLYVIRRAYYAGNGKEFPNVNFAVDSDGNIVLFGVGPIGMTVPGLKYKFIKFEKEPFFENNVEEHAYSDGSSYTYGVGDQIPGDSFNTIIYLFAYDTQYEDTSTSIYYRLLSVKNDLEIRESIKEYIVNDMKDANRRNREYDKK